MTKKELEKKVLELEAKIAELTSAMLALSLQSGQKTVFVPAPAAPPYVPPAYPPLYPTYGDPISNPIRPMITCGGITSKAGSQAWN